MALETIPIGLLTDDSGALLTAPVVTIASVTDKTGATISSPGASVNGSGTLTPISVDYDAETHGEAWITLAVSQSSHTVTGLNATVVIYAAKDSSRMLTALPAVASGAVGGLPLAVDGSGRVDVLDVAGVTFPAVVPSLSVIQAALPNDASITADVESGLTTQGYTPTRAGYLDTLSGLVAAIWSAATRTLSAFGFTPNVVNVTGTIPDVTVGSYASGEDPATLVMAATVDGSLTQKQISALTGSVLTGNYLIVRDTVGKTETVTYYRANGSTVMAVEVTTYSDPGLTLATHRTVTYSNLP